MIKADLHTGKTLAQLFNRSRLLLLSNLLVLLLVGRSFETLPRQTAPQKVHEHMAEGLKIVSTWLFYIANNSSTYMNINNQSNKHYLSPNACWCSYTVLCRLNSSAPYTEYEFSFSDHDIASPSRSRQLSSPDQPNHSPPHGVITPPTVHHVRALVPRSSNKEIIRLYVAVYQIFGLNCFYSWYL